ncbi:hypothetical protein [Psychromicrobium xiongbiense]|uniref:hypothetical protein n=1 Tax=Psychromicrobium xiongbiense TaxID=3051184 RepID=UPI0025565002|nr:hypothetical protein [Psychromicrobium sp. YIM S02556]
MLFSTRHSSVISTLAGRFWGQLTATGLTATGLGDVQRQVGDLLIGKLGRLAPDNELADLSRRGHTTCDAKSGIIKLWS